MGNICGKASDPDASSAGRRLGSGPTTTTTGATSTYGGALNSKPIPTPQKKSSSKPKVTGPGRTLGESASSSGGDSSAMDAREAAARAAEIREQAAKAAGKGALSSKLEAQKRQTRNQQIQELSQQKQTDSEALQWN